MASDLFTAYEDGVQRLLDQLGVAHPERSAALTWQARLLETIAAARRYGDDETLRSARARIIEQLNTLATAVGAPLLLASSEAMPPTAVEPPRNVSISSSATASHMDSGAELTGIKIPQIQAQIVNVYGSTPPPPAPIRPPPRPPPAQW